MIKMIDCEECKFSKNCDMFNNIKRIIRASNLRTYVSNNRMELFIRLYANICENFEPKN